MCARADRPVDFAAESLTGGVNKRGRHYRIDPDDHGGRSPGGGKRKPILDAAACTAKALRNRTSGSAMMLDQLEKRVLLEGRGLEAPSLVGLTAGDPAVTINQTVAEFDNLTERLADLGYIDDPVTATVGEIEAALQLFRAAIDAAAQSEPGDFLAEVSFLAQEWFNDTLAPEWETFGAAVENFATSWMVDTLTPVVGITSPGITLESLSAEDGVSSSPGHSVARGQTAGMGATFNIAGASQADIVTFVQALETAAGTIGLGTELSLVVLNSSTLSDSTVVGAINAAIPRDTDPLAFTEDPDSGAQMPSDRMFVGLRAPRVGVSLADFEATELRNILETLQRLGDELIERATEAFQSYTEAVSGIPGVGEVPNPGLYSGIPFVEQKLNEIAEFGNTLRKLVSNLLDPAEIRGASPVAYPTVTTRFVLETDLFEPTMVEIAPAANDAALLANANAGLAAAGLGDVIEPFIDAGIFGFRAVDVLGTFGLPQTLLVSTTRVDATSAGPAFGQLGADLNYTIDIASRDQEGNLIEYNDVPVTVLASDTTANTTLQDLADDLNLALVGLEVTATVSSPENDLAADGIGGLGNDLSFIVDGSNLRLITTNPDIARITLGGAGETTLGFTNNASSQDTTQAEFADLGILGGQAIAEPKYQDIPSLMQAIADELGVDEFGGGTDALNWEYDEATRSLLFTLTISETFERTLDLDFSEGIDLGGIATLEVAGGAEADASATVGASLRVGIVLSDFAEGLGGFEATTPLTVLNDGAGVPILTGVIANGAPPAGDTLLADTQVDILTNGGPGSGGDFYSVNVAALDTVDNTGIEMLVGDLNMAIEDAGFGDLFNAVVDDATGRVAIVSVDKDIHTLEVQQGAGFGFSGIQIDDGTGPDTLPDLLMYVGPTPMTPGALTAISFSGAVTLGDVKSRMESAFANVVVTFDAENATLVITPTSNGDGVAIIPATYNDDPMTIEVNEGFTSPAGLSLKILGVAEAPSPAEVGVLNGGQTHGKGLLDRVFIAEPTGSDPDNLSIDLSFTADAGDVNLGASLGFAGLVLQNSEDFVATLSSSINLTDPGTGDDADGRIFVSELINLTDIDALIDTTNLLNVTLDGCFELAGDIGGAVSGTLGEVCVTLTDPNDPLSFDFTFETLDFQALIDQIKNFSLEDLIGALRGFLEGLADSGTFDLLNFDIPLVDFSLNDLIEAGEFVLDTIEDLGGLSIDIPALTQIELDLRAAIANLPIDLELKQPFFDLLSDFKFALQGDPLRLPSRLVGLFKTIELRLPDLEALVPGGAANIQFQELLDAFDVFDFNLPQFDLGKVGAKLTDALNDAWPLGGDPFTIDLDLVDFDTGTAGTQYAIVSTLNVAYELDPIMVAPNLPTGMFGPVTLDTMADFELFAGAELNIGFGLALDGGLNAFLITDDPTGNGRTSGLTITAGFEGDFDGEVQFGALDLIGAEADAGLVDAVIDENLPVGGGSITLSTAPYQRNGTIIEEFLFLYDGSSLIDPANYSVSGTTVTFSGVSPSTVTAIYRANAPAPDPSTAGDRASLEFTLGAAPDAGNTIGATSLGSAFSGGIDTEIDGILTAALDATFLGSTASNAVLVATDLRSLISNGPRLEIDDEALLDLFTNLDFNFKTIVAGIDLFLDFLEESLEAEIFEKLPLIGSDVDAAGTFIGDLRENITQPLLELLCAPNIGDTFEAVETAVRNFLFSTLTSIGDGGLLAKLTGGGAVSPSDIIVELTENNFEIGFRIGGKSEIAGINFTTGLDGFPISADGGLTVQFGYDVFVGIGVDRNTGVYLTADPQGDAEFEFDIVAGLAVDDSGDVAVPTSFELDLFGLKFTATDNNVGSMPGTGIFGSLGLDILGFTDGRKLISEIISDFTGSFALLATLDAKIDVELDAGFGDDFPSIAADLVGEWGIDASFSSEGIEFDFGNDPSIGFQDVRLELGDFISQYLGGPVEFFANILQPLEPLLSILNTEVPGVSQISQLAGNGPVRVIDLALLQVPDAAGPAKQFLNVAQTILDIASVIGVDNGEVFINFGSYGFGPLYDNAGLDPRDPNSILSAASDLETNGVTGFFDAAQQVLDSGNAAVEGILSTIQAEPAEGSPDDGGLGIKLDILDPANIFRFLLGQDVNIITWDLPRLELGFDWGVSFNIWPVPPIVLDLGLGFEAFVDLAIGYDTRGLRTGNFIDGFFFSDVDFGNFEDIAEFGLELQASLGAGVGVPGLKAGVKGTLIGSVDFNFRDPDNDTKLYLDEIASIVVTDGIECLFDITAQIRVVLSVYWEILFFKGDADLLDATLLEITNEGLCPKVTPATLVDGSNPLDYNGAPLPAGTLVVHAGEFASLRGGGASDTSEAATIDEVAPGVYQVEVLDIREGFTGVTAILFDGGAGNDSLTLLSSADGVFDIPVMAFGGAGNDSLNGSVVDDTLDGGEGNDEIFTFAGNHTVLGGGGNDTIVAEGGNDSIDGGAGADTIDGGEGNNTVLGGGGSDTIMTGGGTDDIDAGAGADSVLSAGGADTIIGGAGPDYIEAGSGNDSVEGGGGSDTILGLSGNDDLSGGGATDSILGADGNDTISGGGGSDFIDAGINDDVVTGDDGNDEIQLGAGNDFADAGRGNDFVLGLAGSDTILGNWGNDVLIANDIADPTSGVGELIEGGPGDDFICGGDDDDTIVGGTSQTYLDEVLVLAEVVAGEIVAPTSLGGWDAVDCDTLPLPIEVVSGTITVNVADDEDGDGEFDAPEGFEGVTIRLFDAGGDLFDEVATDSTGAAIFTGVEPGTYTAEQVVPDGFYQVTPIDNETIELIVGEGDAVVAAFVDDDLGGVTGIKWLDLDRDGFQDPGEPALPDVTINLFDETGTNIIDSTTTDEEGRYVFDDVVPGDYFIGEVVPGVAPVQTFPAAGVPLYADNFSGGTPATIWSNASNALAPNGQRFAGLYANETVTATVDTSVEHSALIIEFDLYIIGTWEGVDTGAFPFGLDEDLWSVSIIADGENVNETYSFSNVEISPDSPSFPQSFPEPAALGGVNDPGEGAAATGSLGYQSVFDGNPTNIRDAVYKFRYIIPHTGSLLTMNFTGSGLDNDGPNETAGDGEFWGIDNVSVRTLGGGHYVTVTGGDPQGDFDFGNAPRVGDAVGRVMRDDNADGRVTFGDYGLNGRGVRLLDLTTGEIIANATTGSVDLNDDGFIDPFTERGVYQFIGVAPGTYRVETDLPEGWIAGSPGFSGDVQQQLVTVNSFSQVTGDFAQRPAPGNIEGFVYNDANRDGDFNGAETGRIGETVFLDAPDQGPGTTNEALGDGVAGTYEYHAQYSGVRNELLSRQTIDVQRVIGTVDDLDVNVDFTLAGGFTGTATIVGELIAPDGTVRDLFNFTTDATGAGRFNVTFDDSASASIPGNTADTQGTFEPDEFLALFDGDSLQGVWQLSLTSDRPELISVNKWQLLADMVEPTEVTGTGGVYFFGGVNEGLWRTVHVPAAGLELTEPNAEAGDGAYLVRMRSSQFFGLLDFGLAEDTGPAVVDQAVFFYNESSFDNNDPAITPEDAEAIAPDKTPLRPGELATFENVSSYWFGINGLIFDISAASRPLGVNDFTFRFGNTQDPSQWDLAPAPEIEFAGGRATDGSGRYTMVWPNNTLEDGWLQVTINEGAGFDEPEEFYFGTNPGDTDGRVLNGRFPVDTADFIAVRDSQTLFGGQPITTAADHNKSGKVDAVDLIITRDNQVLLPFAVVQLQAPAAGRFFVAPPAPTPGVTLGGSSFGGSATVFVGNIDLTISDKGEALRVMTGRNGLASETPDGRGLAKGAFLAGSAIAGLAESPAADDPTDIFPDPERLVVSYRDADLYDIDLNTAGLSNDRMTQSFMIGISNATVGDDAGTLFGIGPAGEPGGLATMNVFEIDKDTGAPTDRGPIGTPPEIRRLLQNEGALDFMPADLNEFSGQMYVLMLAEFIPSISVGESPRVVGRDRQPEGQFPSAWIYARLSNPSDGPVSIQEYRILQGVEDPSALAFRDDTGVGVAFDAGTGLFFQATGSLEFFPIAEGASEGNLAGADWVGDTLYLTNGSNQFSFLRRYDNGDLNNPISIGTNNEDLSGMELSNARFGFIDGADTIDAQAGDDNVWGDHDLPDPFQYTAEIIIVPDGDNDRIFGGEDDDTVRGQQADDTISGGPKRDADIAPTNSEGNDLLFGGDATTDDGTDLIELAVDNNITLTNISLTGQGNDTLRGFEESQLTGGSSSNIIDASGFNGVRNTLIGGDGDDRILGTPNLDTIVGNAGSDDLIGNDGNDLYLFDTPTAAEADVVTELAGFAAGIDTIDFSAYTSLPGGATGLIINLNSTTLMTDGLRTVGDFTGGGVIENAIGTNFDDEILGNNLANSLVGAEGEDTLRGFGGNDTLDGGDDDDTLAGGTDNDIYFFRPDTGGQSDSLVELPGEGTTDRIDFSALDETQPVIVDLSDPAVIASYIGGTNLVLNAGSPDIEQVLGGDGDDFFRDNTSANIIGGGFGNDYYEFVQHPLAGLVQDTVFDSFGQGEQDTLDLSNTSNGYVIDLTGVGFLADSTNHQIFSSDGFENVFGSTGNDDITGNASDNFIDAGAGDDTIMAGAGNDTLIDGIGSDEVFGQGDDDVYQFSDPVGGDTEVLDDNIGSNILDMSALSLGVTVNPAFNAAFVSTGTGYVIDKTGPASFDRIIGTNFNDNLTGDGTDDTLVGLDGNDFLNGRGGNDSLVGGGDDDIYVFEPAVGTEFDFLVENDTTDRDGLIFQGVGAFVDVTVDISSDAFGVIASHAGRFVGGIGTQFESVIGNSNGNNTITGNDKDNVLFGGAQNDTIIGNKGADTMSAGGGTNDFDGGGGDDLYFFSSAGVSTNNILEADGSVSSGLASGGGNDTLDFNAFTTNVTFNLTVPSQVVGGAATINLLAPDGLGGTDPDGSNFENVIGSQTFANNLTGNDADNLLVGGALNDTIFSGRGDDILIGKAGSDRMSGQEDNDIVLGGDGNDILFGDRSTDPDGGRDLIVGGNGSDNLNGGTVFDDSVEDDIVIGDRLTYAEVLAGISSGFDLTASAFGEPPTAIEEAFEALDAIRDRWTRPDLSYNSRVASIATGVGANGIGTGPYRLAAGITVLADGTPDTIFGESGTDWFFAGTGDTDDAILGEVVTPV
ncbi:MAG: SdrD B-like domain-containing protein [Planctomycetota bacterium]